MQQLREPPLGYKGQAEKLNKIVCLNQLQSNRIGSHFLARSKHQIPDGQDDTVIAVMLLTHSRVVGAMEIRCDDDVGQPLFAGERQVRMVKKHEGHSRTSQTMTAGALTPITMTQMHFTATSKS